MVTALNNSSVVDMDPGNKNVHLWQHNNGANQKWRIVYDSNQNAYQLKNIADENLVLTWAESEGADVKAGPNQNDLTQYWIFEDAGSGYMYLKNKKNPNRVLDVSFSSTVNGTNITVYNLYGGNNQKFKLIKLN
ncbi:RICIN domain-containing protein [Bacillus pacificus]|nr:RICIN domain-containing protein [Bacillus pacificus]